MTYDYHWSTSEAGPLARLDWVDQVLAYAATVVPPKRPTWACPSMATTGPADWRAANWWSDQAGQRNNAESTRRVVGRGVVATIGDDGAAPQRRPKRPRSAAKAR